MADVVHRHVVRTKIDPDYCVLGIREFMLKVRDRIEAWIFWHDKAATHVKIWANGDKVRFRCCVGQEPYGHTFELDLAKDWDDQISMC